MYPDSLRDEIFAFLLKVRKAYPDFDFDNDFHDIKIQFKAEGSLIYISQFSLVKSEK